LHANFKGTAHPHILFDSALNSICRSGYHQLCNIEHIRPYLTSDSTKSVVNRLITYNLDYNNPLLNGLPQTFINKLQRVQNTVARLVTWISHCSRMAPELNRLQDTYLRCWQFTNQEEYYDQWVQWHWWFQGLKHLGMMKEKFQCSAAKLWNALPTHIRESKTLNIKKKLPKTHFFLVDFGV